MTHLLQQAIQGSDEPHALNRRSIILAGGAIFGWAMLPKIASAAGARDPRFVTIVLRGALDGLTAVPPIGDPAYADMRGALALASSNAPPPLALDSFFALHPSMPNFARLYASKQALAVQACATPYRARSHFDGQDILESGFPSAGIVRTGWLNRAIAQMPTVPQKTSSRGLAIGATTPLVIRGPAPVSGWTPSNLRTANDDLLHRVLDLYNHRDPQLARALTLGADIDAMARREEGLALGKPGAQAPLRGAGGGRRLMQVIGQSAARLMAAPDGPRIAAFALDGWDTHVSAGGATGRLAELLGGLDDAIGEIEKGLGPVWKDTVIAVVTEFGRTVQVNGTAGTDHGTGTVALLTGGAVRGGRIITDWPGLRMADLHEGRDLRPTTDLRAVLKGVLRDHLGLPEKALGETIFPQSLAVRAADGLVAV